VGKKITLLWRGWPESLRDERGMENPIWRVAASEELRQKLQWIGSTYEGRSVEKLKDRTPPCHRERGGSGEDGKGITPRRKNPTEQE